MTQKLFRPSGVSGFWHVFLFKVLGASKLKKKLETANVLQQEREQLSAITISDHQVKAQLENLQQELALTKTSLRDATDLYFATLSLSLKLRATMLGVPITADLTMLQQEAAEVPLEQWPAFLSSNLLKGIEDIELNDSRELQVSAPENVVREAATQQPAQRSWLSYLWS